MRLLRFTFQRWRPSSSTDARFSDNALACDSMVVFKLLQPYVAWVEVLVAESKPEAFGLREQDRPIERDVLSTIAYKPFAERRFKIS
ncbi:hypothetical protein HPB51_027501 [Rhipicephalus microplus]|uniref:Uncharacterized protein n=1 Tax=Rhipicephalus microplus TaxID=6941 RepID=A0A9J6D010_RHIMP|nr:hypothetical protein HPB51_027501 [Rhipicephalus microplus]